MSYCVSPTHRCVLLSVTFGITGVAGFVWVHEHHYKESGGTLIGVKSACQFAAATGASVCHHDKSIPSLAADYDPFLDMPPLTEESWEARHKQITNGDEAVQIAAGDEYYDYYLPDAETIITEEALDLLTAEDPAMLSDDFSNPDDFFDEDEYDDFSEDDDDG
ncbi:uncharacterized protein [Dysidea avara]|uniref:uncharacterized protein isoform X3 n=1 Tax=Dysidea avara TaxID=196820 RepID=UPI00332DFB24